MVLGLLKAFLSWIIILPSVFVVGSWCIYFVRFENVVLRGVLYCAIGMACFSYSIVVLSAAHLLNPLSIWISLFIPLVINFSKLKSWAHWLKTAWKDFNYGESPSLKVLRPFFFASFFALLLGTLSPEIGGDSLTYHLNLPKVFLAKASIGPDFYDLNSYFPLFLNNLYLIGLATGGVLAAKLFHFFCGLLLFVTMKIMVKQETENEVLAFFIALVVWLTPVVYNMLSTTYIEIGMTFYTFLALCTLATASQQKDRFTFFLSGFFVGCAISIKYLTLISLIAFLAIMAIQVYSCLKHWNYIKLFVFWFGGFCVAGAYWILRNWWIAGNPVFPYFPSVFGTEAFTDSYYHRFGGLGMGRSLFAFISIFWNMFYHPSAFGAFSDRVGIFYFFFIPFVIVGALFVSRARLYALFSLFFLGIWFYVAPMNRYVVSALPAMSVAAAIGFQWVLNNLPATTGKVFKVFAGSLGFTALTFYLLVGVYHYRYTYLLDAGWWSPSTYLERMERTFPIATWINEHLPLDAKILLQSEPRQFYINRSVMRDIYFKHRTQYSKLSYNSSSLRTLFKSFHISHLLTSTPASSEIKLNQDPQWDSLLRSPFVRMIYTVRSKNIRDDQYIYQLYELN